MEWYYAQQGQQFGPVDEEELLRLAQEGQLSPDDLVWNSTLGDEWVEASSIDKLSGLLSPNVASDLFRPADDDHEPGTTHNRDLMAMARESLQGYWGLAVGVGFLYFIIDVGLGLIPEVGFLIRLLVNGPMLLGFCTVFLLLARRSPTKVGDLFKGFRRFGTALAALLLTTLFVILWSLLLIVPGIIASYAYAMTFFVLADDPTAGPLEAIKRSKTMMQGNKWKLFCLFWRFFGWTLLCLLTLGIGFLWLVPYMQTTLAHFYDDVMPRQ